MLIVPRALHCVNSCIFVFTSFDTVWHTVLVSVPPPPPPPQSGILFWFQCPLPPPPPPRAKFFFIRFSFFVKIHLLELTVRVVGLPPLSPSFFYQMLISIKISRIGLFKGSDRPRMLFVPLINVKMPTIVGILTFMGRKNFVLS